MTVLSSRFQFTHPCGCDELANVIHYPITSFNSRTRVGATRFTYPSRIPDGVSIHAPVWVRQLTNPNNKPIERFQFTHPCGCDLHRPNILTINNSFNSRTRVGATKSARDGLTSQGVSIHAPVWVRLWYLLDLNCSMWFQFTHPCGCDVYSRVPSPVPRSFNSRTRVGATPVSGEIDTHFPVSIHAPVWVRQVANC